MVAMRIKRRMRAGKVAILAAVGALIERSTTNTTTTSAVALRLRAHNYGEQVTPEIEGGADSRSSESWWHSLAQVRGAGDASRRPGTETAALSQGGGVKESLRRFAEVE
jgi:hypothetical protein